MKHGSNPICMSMFQTSLWRSKGSQISWAHQVLQQLASYQKPHPLLHISWAWSMEGKEWIHSWKHRKPNMHGLKNPHLRETFAFAVVVGLTDFGMIENHSSSIVILWVQAPLLCLIPSLIQHLSIHGAFVSYGVIPV